jgi:hypothetical protein
MKFLFQLSPCSHWLIFFSVYSWLTFRKISGSQAAFGTTFEVTGAAAIRNLEKRFYRKIFTISNKAAKKCENLPRLSKKISF